MKGLIALTAVTLAIGAPSAAQRATETRPAAQAEAIELEMWTWGRPMTRWSITPAGALTFTTPEPDPFKAERMVTRRYQAGETGYARIRTLTSEAAMIAAVAGAELPCTRAITDAPYGELRWTGGDGQRRTLRFYTACEEADARRIIGQLQQADDLAIAWRDAGEIVETRKADGQ
ncbi:hypothetical protein [Sphingomonas soli]|uniref:hypothetical protein n=1 Tax=Sphingomonas soli TaxID=266127 RepID=UPI00082FFE6D|nr:hypothetical protein [Sphingomonas soli]